MIIEGLIKKNGNYAILETNSYNHPYYVVDGFDEYNLTWEKAYKFSNLKEAEEKYMEIKTIENKREVTDKREMYFAIDGVGFSNPDECREYEDALKTVLKVKLKDNLIKKTTEDCLHDDIGNGDHDLEIYDITSEKVANDLSMYIALMCYDTNKSDFTKYVGQKLIVAWNYDHDYCWWYTIDGLVKQITENYEKLMKGGK